MGKGQARRLEGLWDVFRAHQHKGSIGELRYGVSVLNAGGQGTPYATNTPPKSEIPVVASITQCGSAQCQTPSKSRTLHSTIPGMHLHLHLNSHAMQHHHTWRAHPVPSEQPHTQGHPESHSTSMPCDAHQRLQRETVLPPAAIRAHHQREMILLPPAIDWQFGSVNTI